MIQNLINKPKHQVGSGNQTVDINPIYTGSVVAERPSFIVNDHDFSNVTLNDSGGLELWRNCRVGQFLRFDGNDAKYGLVVGKDSDKKVTVDLTYYQDPSDETFDFNTSPYAGQIDVLNYFVDEN